MTNILLVFTGGTIGSAANEGTINTSDAAPFKLLQQFQRHYSQYQEVNFKTLQPIQLLSENLAPAAWKIIFAAIETEHPAQYDGIIITHGTDTLAYTAAALSFYFHALNVPMLLVSSDYPLDDARANGLDNFICAVGFIRQKIATGVFVPYRNQGQTMQLHRGNRLACSLQLSGDFFSVQGKSLMAFENQEFSQPYLANSDAFLPPEGMDKPRLKAEFSEQILMIKPFPGLDYSHFSLQNIRAVIHDLYHSGTACASSQWGENHSLLTFVKTCTQQGIKVYLAPAVKSASAYQSTQALIDQGAEMIWNMSIEAAYIKLLLAYGNFSDERQIADFINRDIAGEHV